MKNKSPGTRDRKEKKPEKMHLSDKHELAKSAIYHSINAAAVVDAYGVINPADVDILDLAEALKETCAIAISGDLSGMEAMLISQSVALQTIFTYLARRASKQELMAHYQTFLTLALKAQAQSRATIQALVELKYPRQVSFVNQANIANGPQQVNNAYTSERTESRTEENQSLKNKLSPQLEDTRHERQALDFGTTSKASKSDPELETVGKINRTKDRSR